MLISDFTGKEGPQDHFKQRFKVERKQDLPVDPTKKEIPLKPVDPNATTNHKWTNLEVKFLTKRNTRLMDNLKQAVQYSTDLAPLYSSMTKDGIFVAPPTTKEVLAR